MTGKPYLGECPCGCGFQRRLYRHTATDECVYTPPVQDKKKLRKSTTRKEPEMSPDENKFDFAALRDANLQRQAEWPGAGAVDMFFRTLELAGEGGELVNVVKKLVRLDRSISGTTEPDSELADAIKDELGDVAVCLDLVGMTHPGVIDLSEDVIISAPYEGGRSDLAQIGSELDARIGWVCETWIDIHFGMVSAGEGPRDRESVMKEAILEAHDTLQHLARVLDYDLWECTIQKFNATSRKHGLSTRLGRPDQHGAI